MLPMPRLIAPSLALLVFLAACAPSRPVGVRTDKVRVFDDPAKPEKDWGYDPRTIEVAKGTSVTFTNAGAEYHTITSSDPTRAFDAGVSPKEQATIRFDKPGTWPYHCGVHPDMTGVVLVCDGACE